MYFYIYFESKPPPPPPPPKKAEASKFPALSPDLVWVRLPSITAVWRGGGWGGEGSGVRRESWLGPEACSDGEIFLRLGGNH